MANNPLTKFVYERNFCKGFFYADCKEQMAMDFISNADTRIQEYILLNQSRMRCLEKTYTPSEELLELLRNLSHKIYWLVLAEQWCGDALQTLPVLNKISEFSSGKIELKLVYRDLNLGSPT